MSAHCNDCGTDIVYPAGTWPLGICPVCELRAELAVAQQRVAEAEKALREVRAWSERVPPPLPSGSRLYVQGVIDRALSRLPEAAAAGEPVEGEMCPATLRACDVPQYCTDDRYGCARLRASGTDAAASGAAP